MFSAWKFGLSNIVPCWSAIPTLKLACAGAAAAAAAQISSATIGTIRLCMVIATDDTHEGCGMRWGKSVGRGPNLNAQGGDRDSPEGQADRAAPRAAGPAGRLSLPRRAGP